MRPGHRRVPRGQRPSEVHLVGLTETEVREARDRVRAALQNSDFDLSARKITDGPGSERPFDAQQVEVWCGIRGRGEGGTPCRFFGCRCRY